MNMRSFPGIRISLFVVLVGLGWRVGEHLVTPPMIGLAAVLVVCAAALFITAVRRLRRSLPVAVIVVAMCGASTLTLRQIAWRLHDIPVSQALGPVAANLVPGAGSTESLLTFWTGRGLETVRLTFEGFGLYEIWYIVIALIALTVLSRSSRSARRLPANLGIILLYSVMRFVVLVAIAIEWGRVGLLWDPAVSVMSWLPLALVLRPPDRLEIPRLLQGGWRHVVMSVLTATLAGSCLASVLGYADPGNAKQGRVVVDEAHSNWEWTATPFDTTSLGIRAEYNYYCLVDYLSHFYDVDSDTGGISQSLLDSVDVLVIKTPTEPFTDEEVETIAEFVRAGGGLLLIGDHTNLFGMTDFLNPIGQRFGMEFRYDDSFELATTGFSTFKRPRAVFHPSLRGLDEFEFLTSCTVVGDLHTEPVMIGCGLGSEDVDYGHPNFFGNIAYDLRDRFGLFLQACSRRFGRGRVLLFTDSTCFSNFCVFAPGRRELILGFMDYLNREGTRYPWVRPVILTAFGILSALSLWSLKRVPGGFGLLCAGACVGLVVGTAAVGHLNGRLHGPLPEAAASPTLFFDTGHTNATLFDYLGLARQRGHRGFEQFYLCAQRIGMYPTTGDVADINHIVPRGAVLTEPCSEFSEEELDCLTTYVRNGGRLLVLDSVLNERSTANEVLGQFGMMVYVDSDLRDTAIPDASARLRIHGGRVIKVDGSGNTAVAATSVEAGVVAVAVDSFRYSEYVLGAVLQKGKPPALARTLYRDVCSFLSEVFLKEM
ncbi:MAG: DUF4350 domain-containing protein [Candidatus Eisenbacteria bacterium]